MAGYADIAGHFRRQIEGGELRPGDRLPTLREVMQEFGVAQQTASRAYARLRTEGLTTATTGGGTVVAPYGSDGVAARVAAHAATGRALAQGETSRILEVGTVPADETVAHRLGVEPGTPVHVRRRVVSRGGVPVHYSSSYYPAYVIEAVPELTEPVSTGASRELAAERLGVPQAQVLEEISPRLATVPEAEALGLTGQVIVNQIVRTVWLADSRTVEVGVKVTATVLRYSTAL
ncbi:GntR family transcriptional regulator [Kitasatospora cheerisanensis]|uniref:GntR family transcriptional regulator n=1 Tax=Kitasatospora cheerisanensis KCTC 2395 TaxID=1348663 RepID=A0A066YKH2_9ACTN|nr:GntR family transcriptional regulator [Kitasatospora cheerisanensis]KDN80434.1 GntR family transcriptional regulator [Kitasatospora cheerisanensis KCTC 2395]